MTFSTRVAIIFALLLPAVRGVIPSLSGEILSPNFPQCYPNNVKQSWNITVPPGYGIRIYFTHLDIEPSENCTYDSVQIVIGDIVKASLCGKHSSHSRQTSVRKYDMHFPSQRLTLMFQSDFSNQQRYTGFAAYYAAEDVDECEDQQEVCSHFCNNYLGGFFCSCPGGYFMHDDNRTCGMKCSGGVYSELKGEISSPDYPNPYPENTLCKYRIQLEYGYHIVVMFQEEDFDIEPDDTGRCVYDKLVVQVKNQTFGPFCGSSIPNPSKIETQSNVANIIFQTDIGGQHKGWKIHYYEEPVQCNSVAPPHSTLEPQRQKYVFKDVVTVVCVEGYEVVENDKGKKSFKKACQSDGQWNRTDLICQPVNCGPPDELDNAEVKSLSGDDNYDYDSEIQYSCTQPYYQMEPTGNGLYRCSADGHWENSNAGKTLPKCVPVCGGGVPLSGSGKIFGGNRTVPGMFPWQVFFDKPRGGGALISDDWVLTAAHVVEGEPNPTMYVGVRDVKHVKDPKHISPLEVKDIYYHSDWKKNVPEPRTDFDNDIALIKLKTKVKLGPNVLPICLPGRGTEYALEEGKVGFISGWGKTEKRDKAQILQMAGIQVVEMGKCQGVKPAIGDSSQYVFSKNMICAGWEGKDSCEGDSGGAFAVQVPQKHAVYYAAGIVSWGPECGTYGLYTNVRNYLDWIEETIKGPQET